MNFFFQLSNIPQWNIIQPKIVNTIYTLTLLYSTVFSIFVLVQFFPLNRSLWETATRANKSNLKCSERDVCSRWAQIIYLKCLIWFMTTARPALYGQKASTAVIACGWTRSLNYWPADFWLIILYLFYVFKLNKTTLCSSPHSLPTESTVNR